MRVFYLNPQISKNLQIISKILKFPIIASLNVCRNWQEGNDL